MSEKRPQTLENHAKLVPLYHFVTLGLSTIYILWTVWTLIRTPSLDAVFAVVLALTVFLVAFYARVFPLKVQDRLIRLEERQRLARVLPEALRPRIDELTEDQLVALRFASDEELSELVAEVLDHSLTQRGAIKKKIKTWRPDYFRC